MPTKKIKKLPNGELYIEFSDEEMEAVGWAPGDVVKWEDNGDDSWTLSRADDHFNDEWESEETELVLVEAVSVFRMRYVVEVPKGDHETARDMVVCGDVKEFSQEHLDEVITSHRFIDEEEAIELAREDNSYVDSWDDEKVYETFVTPLGYENYDDDLQ